MKVRTRRHKGKSHPVANAKKRKNPLRVDPTRTQTLRRKFLARIRKQFGLLKGRLIRLVVDEDAFGIKLRQQGISANSNPEGCNQYKPCGTSTAEVSGSLTDLVAHYESHPDPQVRSALGKAYDRAVNLISGLALKKLPEKALESVDEWIYKQTVTAAGHEVLGIPATALLLKVGSAGAAKAWLKVRKAITGNTLSANSDDDPLTVLRELLKRLAEVGGWEVPSEEEMRKMLEISPQKPTTNVRFAFRTDPEKITAFQDWLRTQFGQLLTGKNEEDLWRAFTEDGYRRGASRAFDDTKSSAYVRANATDRMEHYEGTRDEFLRSSFARPVAVEKVKLLAGRAFDDLENVTTDMATRMSRTLTDGLVTGSSPREIARDLSDDLDLSRGRAETIARSEIVRAHAEGQLDAMETLGVTQVGVQAEWLVTDDEKLCDECAPLEGIVLDIDEARGMLPRHPNCRCAWMPANVGEDDEDQKRSAREIEAAVRDSQEAGDDDFDIEVSTVRPTRNAFSDTFYGCIPLNPSLVEFSRLLGNAFCPTGEGGGIDPTCSPSGGGSTEAKLPKSAKDAGQAMADALAHTRPEVAADPVLRAKVASNWARDLKGKIISKGADFDALSGAIRDNADSKELQEVMSVHGPQAVVLLKGDGVNRRAESIGASIHVYSHSIEPLQRKNDPPGPGAFSSEDQGGVAAVLRHEYAHRVLERMPSEEKSRWDKEVRSLYPNADDIKAELTQYAGKAAGKSTSRDEVFTEAFAIGTSSTYNPSRFSDRAQQLIRTTLSVSKVKPTTANARSFFADCERDEKGHCLPSGAGGAEVASPKELKAARKLAMEKAANAPVPTVEDVAKAQEGIARLGANKYRRNIVGNTKDRAKRRQHLYDEFGDGSTCPCIYCGIKVGEGTLEQDKIYTTAEGGKYNTKNVVPSCSECNKKRGDVPFREIQWGKVK